MRHLSALIVAAVLPLLPAGAQAQAPAPPAAEAAIDASALGVSIPRIARRLRADAVAAEHGDEPLKLEYFVDVYGTAPALRFFSGQDLVFGGVPFSAPTHADMIYQVTPQAFRSPVADVFGLAMIAAKAGVNKAEDWRYQRDLRAYQKLVEAGQNVPAPRPPRRY